MLNVRVDNIPIDFGLYLSLFVVYKYHTLLLLCCGMDIVQMKISREFLLFLLPLSLSLCPSNSIL